MANTKKLDLAKSDVISTCGCANGCSKCGAKLQFLEKMFDSCIPVMYWSLKMSEFTGAANIKESVMAYTADLPKHYKAGTNVCFSGTLGTGKTYSMANILKAALAQDFTAHYVSLIDLVSGLTNNSIKYSFGDLLMNVDFLAIDEVDSRHIAQSDAAQDFYGTSFERVLRSRLQNRLPTLIATNNSSLEEAFGRQFRKTIESLSATCMTVVPALGKDFRMEGQAK